MIYNPTKGLVWLIAPAGYTMNMILGELGSGEKKKTINKVKHMIWIQDFVF